MAVVDIAIGDLPSATQVADNDLLVLEQAGKAKNVSGKTVTDYLAGRSGLAGYTQRAEAAATNAEGSNEKAALSEYNAKASEDAASLSERNAKASEEQAAASEQEAKNSETLSQSWAVGDTGSRLGENADNAKYYANKAQGYAESMTIPAAENIYNVVLTDRVTGDKYALLVENGRLVLLGVSLDVTATTMTLIDPNTGVSYAVVVDNGRLGTEEV